MTSLTTRLRVAHIITQLELGGAQRNTLYTVLRLNRHDFEPSLICGPGGILDDEAKESGSPVYFVPSLVRPIRPWKDIPALITLYKMLRKQKPHIVHTHSSKAGILGRLAAYLAGVPVIIHTFHGFGFTPGQSGPVRRLFIWAEKMCAYLSTHLIFVSKDNEEEAQALGIGITKPHSLIRSGIRIEEPPLQSSIREELQISDKTWVVVTVGNFKPQKNPIDAAKVAKAVLDKEPDVEFLFVGEGELRTSVESYVLAEGIASRFRFLGWRKDIPAILSASNCFLLTSLWEGLPRALVEASAARLPSVAYAVNGVKDILIDGQTGFPIEPNDVAAAAQKILWLKDNPAEAKTIGSNARQRIEKEFDIDTMVRDQENLYKSLYQAVPLKEYYEPQWTLPSNP